MDLRNFDLNLLLMLDALLKERSVTQAAHRLGVSQPTVSVALNKLRAAFQDELFVKMTKGMEPTTLARELERPLAAVLATVQEELLNRSAFDPETTERTFVVIGGELGQMVFVHRLLLKLRQAAPRARVRFVFPDAHDCQAALEDGRADMALGYFPQLASANLFQQQLYARPLVCVARTGHPALADGQMTVEKFCALEHAVVGTLSNLDELIEPELRRLGHHRRRAVELGHATGTPYLLANSDLIAIVPEVLARIYCQDGKLQSWPVPVPLPLCEVRQFWHRKVHGDPAVTWLRNTIAREFQVHVQTQPL